MKILVVLAVSLVAASAAQLSASEVASHWRAFKSAHSKLYSSAAQEEFRKNIFVSNLLRVQEHNARYDQGLETYKTAVNEYSDLLDHEANARLNGLRMDATRAARRGGRVHFADPKSPAVTRADWRKKGLVTRVKNQLKCGSCWAFSTTGAVEGQLYKKTGKLVSLSEQHLVDCSKSNAGCNGGYMPDAFNFIKKNGGIQTEESYPYEAVDNHGCRYNASLSAGTVTGYVSVNPTEADLQHAVATVGPVSIAIDAGGWNFRHYSGGVFYDPACSSYHLNHGVLAVGFGSSFFHGDYWLVKNSWGADWGEEGYVRIARNRDNHCGIATEASYPTV